MHSSMGTMLPPPVFPPIDSGFLIVMLHASLKYVWFVMLVNTEKWTERETNLDRYHLVDAFALVPFKRFQPSAGNDQFDLLLAFMMCERDISKMFKFSTLNP
jgi:hypothetical protein